MGTLWIEGDTAALCYWNEHEKTKQTFHGDAVNTGDLFVRDPAASWYRGRSDELIKVGGIWIAPPRSSTAWSRIRTSSSAR